MSCTLAYENDCLAQTIEKQTTTAAKKKQRLQLKKTGPIQYAIEKSISKQCQQRKQPRIR